MPEAILFFGYMRQKSQMSVCHIKRQLGDFIHCSQQNITSTVREWPPVRAKPTRAQHRPNNAHKGCQASSVANDHITNGFDVNIPGITWCEGQIFPLVSHSLTLGDSRQDNHTGGRSIQVWVLRLTQLAWSRGANDWPIGPFHKAANLDPHWPCLPCVSLCASHLLVGAVVSLFYLQQYQHHH